MYLVSQYDVLATKQLHRTMMWLQNYNDSSSLSGIYHCHWFIIVTGSSLSLMHHCHWCIPVTDSSLSRIRYCHLFFTVTDSSLVQWFFTVTGSMILHCHWFVITVNDASILILIHYFILVTNFSPNLIPHCKLFLTVNDTSFSLINTVTDSSLLPPDKSLYFWDNNCWLYSLHIFFFISYYSICWTLSLTQ